MNVVRAPSGVTIETKGFHAAECSRRKLPDQIRIPSGYELSAPGNKIDQPTECELHCIDVTIDIGVIELDVVEDYSVGQIVHEFRTLIEIRGVVFIAFDYEVRAVCNSE